MADIEQQKDDREDYDSRADKLWSVYNKEAEVYDRALMETWKDDMDTIIIFAGLFSAVLTAFLIDTSKKLNVDPTEQTNALLSQTVVLLSQISQQLGPNGSQVVISPPQPLEAFQVASSDLRVNIFWFMSLGFSLTAALAATLVQQWIRDYLQVFQRMSGSLGRSRMRQFLFHGLTSNHVSILVELIPAFIHISLFLFFIGLADNLFATNKTVAITTSIIIGFWAFLYSVCSLFPIIYTKTPYHTPLSKFIWIIVQTAHLRKYSNSDTGGKAVPVDADIGTGRFQIAMSGDRMKRDSEAIRWVLTKITEDREFEPFAAGIAGSFATSWGRDVWGNIFTEDKEGNMDSTLNIPIDSDALTALSRGLAELARGRRNGGRARLGDIHEKISRLRASNVGLVLKIRIDSLLKTCADSTFLDQQSRFTRSCVCIDAVASLSLCFGEGSQFGVDVDLMTQVLIYIGQERKRRERQAREARIGPLNPVPNSAPQLDIQITGTLIEIKWKCMMIIAMKKILRDPDIANAVQGVLDQLHIRRPINHGTRAPCQNLMTDNDVKRWLDKKINLNTDKQEELAAREVDKELLKAWRAVQLLRSHRRQGRDSRPSESSNESLSGENLNGYVIKTIQESLNALLHSVKLADHTDLKIVNLVNCLMRKTGCVLEQLGSASFEWPSGITRPGRTPIFSEIRGMVMEPPDGKSTSQLSYCVTTILDNKWIMPHLLPPRMLISNFLVYASPRLGGTTDPMTPSQIDLNSPGLGAELLDRPEINDLMTDREPGPFEKQLWRLRDLRDGGTGFILELFFTTFGVLRPGSLTPESEKLIEATLRAITENGRSKSLNQPACRRCLEALQDELEEVKENLESNPESTRISGFILNILQKLINDVINSDREEEGGSLEEAKGEKGGDEEATEEGGEGTLTEDDDKEGVAGRGNYVQHVFFNEGNSL